MKEYTATVHHGVSGDELRAVVRGAAKNGQIDAQCALCPTYLTIDILSINYHTKGYRGLSAVICQPCRDRMYKMSIEQVACLITMHNVAMKLGT